MGLLLARRARPLNLRVEDIDVDELTAILSRVENEVSKFIRERISPSIDYYLVLGLSKSDSLTLVIDLNFAGRYEDVSSYKSIIDDAIEIGRRVFEREIERYRANKQQLQ